MDLYKKRDGEREENERKFTVKAPVHDPTLSWMNS